MRNISFMLTTQQMYDGIKDVTRRIGWANAKPGDYLMACEKCQGLKHGEHIKRIGLIQVLSNTPEPLNAITLFDVRREGFPDKSKRWFIEMFCEHNKCQPDTIIHRIVFDAVYKKLNYIEAKQHYSQVIALAENKNIFFSGLRETLGIPKEWENAIISTLIP